MSLIESDMDGIMYCTHCGRQLTESERFCPSCGCSTYNETFDWSTGEAGKPMISVNARLFDDFDLDVVPVEHVDGKHLW